MGLRFGVLCALLLCSLTILADDSALQQLKAQIQPLKEHADLAALIEAASDSRLALLGEASHGTSEFYSWRTHISRKLIEEHDFRFIAVEGDWQSSYRLNRYVRGMSDASHSRQILETFDRWPNWLWANDEVIELLEWLKAHNADLPLHKQVGFYGVDLYGHEPLFDIISEQISRADEKLAVQIAEHFSCFEPFADDLQVYARAVANNRVDCSPGAEKAVDLIKRHTELKEALGVGAYYHLLQSVLVIKHAERHYAAMHKGGAIAWNIRADFFNDTAQRLLGFFGDNSKGIIWAHNTHIGDARATSMQTQGQRNIGQLARQSLGDEQVFAIGFATYRGMVVAANAWGETRQIMPVPAAMEGSLEHLLHQLDEPRFFVMLGDKAPEALQKTLGHRAIGVVYRPQMERFGNYVESRVDQRYDALVYIDKTTPLMLLDD